MARRSSRLVSGGYYNSDEESDSSSVTNISYRENPVKVFKKKSGARKSASRTNSNASSAPETPVTPGLSPVSSPLRSPPQPTIRTVPDPPAAPTHRPALTPSSTNCHMRCHSKTPEKSSHAGPHSSGLLGLHKHKEPGQSGVDSSGYSSSEGQYGKPLPVTSTPRRTSSSSGAALGLGFKSRISDAFFHLMDSASVMAANAHKKVLHVTSTGLFCFSVCLHIFFLIKVFLGNVFILSTCNMFFAYMPFYILACL
ncbi:uncharacterized protein LOC119796320 isoform X2 [Cyprinodon tularosa]|nr:uncharacterized protein LOC119796320 isoform X2 [Cyprinodon tularosa]XP_038160752.1 uncharacterized protein LOC119796320 isoform X2 [Cyprinodon tularosa]